MTKRTWIVSLALAGLTAAALAQTQAQPAGQAQGKQEGGIAPRPGSPQKDGVVPAPAHPNQGDGVVMLAQAYHLIAAESYEEALQKLLWCYDEAPRNDENFYPIRDIAVLDAISSLTEVHPAALAALKARRDAAMAQIGDPIVIGPALYDVMAINRALGDYGMNEQLITKAAAGKKKEFSTAKPAPDAPKMADDEIRKRAQLVRDRVRVSNKAQAQELLRKRIVLTQMEQKAVQADIKAAQTELDGLQTQVQSQSAGAAQQKHEVIGFMRRITKRLVGELRPLDRSLKSELDYYAQLEGWVKQMPE
jgi:hypothetical protein